MVNYEMRTKLCSYQNVNIKVSVPETRLALPANCTGNTTAFTRQYHWKNGVWVTLVIFCYYLNLRLVFQGILEDLNRILFCAKALCCVTFTRRFVYARFSEFGPQASPFLLTGKVRDEMWNYGCKWDDCNEFRAIPHEIWATGIKLF